MVAAPKPVDLPSIRKETLSIDAPDPSPPSNANVGWGATNKPSIAAAATSDSMEGGKASSLVSAATSTPGSTPTTSVWGAKISGAAIVQRSIIQEPNANDVSVEKRKIRRRLILPLS